MARRGGAAGVGRLRRLDVDKTTLFDVARHAGVSAATVSRVINSPEKVSPALRERVAAAVDELHYVPHGPARALASRRSRTVGAVVPTLGIAIFAQGVVALQRRLEAAGYTLLVANAEYDLDKEALAVRALIERGVDGLVLVGAKHAPGVYSLLANKRIPHVNTYNYGADDEDPCIGIDHARAAGRMAEYLLDLGHRSFGVITSPVRNNDRIADRLEGILAALARGGAPVPASRVLEVPYGIAEGRIALRTLMSGIERPTAVACTADALAIGALQECRAIGLRVPRDVSVSGFDDLELSMHMDPPLTTVQLPATEMGERAADYLLARIAGRSVPDHVELSASLIVRGSTGRPGG